MQSTSGNLSPSTIPPLPAAENTVPQSQDSFHWITNEGLLRDEGALFGIAAADIQDKLNAIESYFKTFTAAPLQKKQFLEQKIQEHDLVLSVSRKELITVEAEIKDNHQQHNLLPALIQLLAVASVCVFNFFVVRWWLSPAVDTYLVCAGIYLSGLFSVYLSLAFKNEKEEEQDERVKRKRKEEDEEEEAEKRNEAGWKISLREIAVAAIVAFFICTLTYKAYPPAHSFAAFLVLSVMFLAGKVLMSSFFRIKKEGTIWLAFAGSNWRLRRQEKSLNKAIDKAVDAISAAKQEMQEPAILIKQLEADQEYKTRIFLSEYNLALQSRNASSTKSPAKQFA